MSVAGVNGVTPYSNYNTNAMTAVEKKAEESKKNTETSEGAVYQKSSSNTKNAYSVNKASASDRKAMIDQLKADQAKRQSQLIDIVNQTITGQAKKFTQANDDLWKFLAKGDFTVDAETKLQAQKDIGEDGYYGVNKTAQRIFDFASALAGDDVEKMKKMQAAFEKGYGQAEKAWGGDLPGISGQTKDAVNQMFDDYYNSKNTFVE